MHDIDRTSLESNGYSFEDEMDAFEEEMDYEEEEFDQESDYENDYESDYENDYESDYESDYENDLETGSPFSEEEEAELAYELLSVSSEEEMDEFFKGLFKKLKRFGGKALGVLGKGLKGIAKVALPIAGKVAGGIFGGPIGSALGGGLGSAVSNIFEIEMEGLSPEDQEFEIARRFVRLSGEAAKNAAKNSRRMPPQQAAKLGLKQAARQHAPGLLKPMSNIVPVAAQKTGRWYKVGDKIVLIGLLPNGNSARTTPAPPSRRAVPVKKRR